MKKIIETREQVEIKKIFKAILDINGVYFGMEEVVQLLEGDVEVPENCDLPPGKYKWVPELSQFYAVPKSQHTITPNAPLADRALYEVIKSMPNPPAYCLEWCAWFEKTLDGSNK